MAQREISQMLNNSLQSLNLLVDSSKVIGSPLHIDENKILIPLSKVTFGFGVGGSEFNTNKGQIINNDLIENESYPFGGGTFAFLMIDNDNSKIIRVEQGDTLFDKLLELSISLLKKSNKKSTK